MHPDNVATKACRLFGWTYQEYLDAPMWLVHLAAEQERVEEHERKAKANDHQQ
jgi:hypothetical protein